MSRRQWCAFARYGPTAAKNGGGQGEPMAMILEFRSLSREDPREAPEPRSAQIIIFPGVRRERHAEPNKQQRRRDKVRPKRDRLELPD
jgi:hypothetical protein